MTVPYYIFSGLDVKTQKDVVLDKGIEIKKMISFNKLKDFIEHNYPESLARNRKSETVKVRRALLYTIDKYIHKILKMDDEQKANMTYITHHIFKQDHSTAHHSLDVFNNQLELNNKYGLHEEEVRLQMNIEVKFLRHFVL